MSENKTCIIKFEKVNSQAVTPIKGSPDSVGYDLFSSREFIIKPNRLRLVSTDISCLLVDGLYAEILGKSGVGLNLDIQVITGVIDPDYQRGIGILAYNFGNKDVVIPKHTRIAQIVFKSKVTTQLEESSNIFV